MRFPNLEALKNLTQVDMPLKSIGSTHDNHILTDDNRLYQQNYNPNILINN